MKTKHLFLLCSLFFVMALTTGHAQETDYSWPLPDQAQLKADLLIYFNGLTSWVIKNTGRPMPFQPASIVEFSTARDADAGEFRGRIRICIKMSSA
jgi:hypothetical protein